MRFIAFFVIGLLFAIPDLQSNTHIFHVKEVKLKDNFAVQQVNDIAEDHYGYLWIATDAGLLKFDGDSVTRYFANRGDSTALQHHFINTLLIDKNSNLWIGTHNGLHLYDYCSEGFIYFGPQPENYDELRGRYINDMVMDEKGVIWIATYRGLTRFDYSNRSFDTYDQTNTNLPTRDITALQVLPDKSLLMGTKSYGLWKFSEGVFSPCFPNISKGKLIWDIMYDQDSILWIATETAGLYKIRQTRIENFFSGQEIKTITQFPDDNLLISNQIWIRKQNQFESIQLISDVAIDQNILAAYKTSSGIEWLITSNKILRREKEETLTIFPKDIFQNKKNRLPSVTSISVYNNRQIAYKLDGLGGYLFDSTNNFSKKIYETGYLYEFKNPVSIIGKRWFYLTKEGLFATNIEDLTTTKISTGSYRFLIKSPDNNLYLVPNTDRISSILFYNINEDLFKNIKIKSTASQVLPNLGAVGVQETKDSVLSIFAVEGESTISGLIMKKPGDGYFEYVARMDDAFKNLFINDITKFSERKYLLGTENGLYVYSKDEKKMKPFKPAGKKMGIVKAIYPIDNAGYLLTTSQELHFLKTKNQHPFNIELMQDVESLNFNIRSIYKQQAGAYLIGHDHGIIRFNPENKHLSKDDSRIIISKLSYQKEDRLIRKHNPSICNARYKLPFKAEDIEFNFNSPGLPAASSLYWQYRLTPEDSIWQIAPIHRKSAYYEKIKPADSLTFTIRLVDFSGEIYASESINLDVKKETKIHLPLILFLLITLILTGIILIRKKIRTKRNSLHSGSQMNGKQYAIPEHLDSFILSHLDDQNLSSANIEKHFGISRTKLFRVLKEKTGKSVTAYIRDVRLEEAEKLLNSKKFSVSEVIYKVGFNSRSYFYKCYKEKFGKNPKRPS